jgi:hypothetical protein
MKYQEKSVCFPLGKAAITRAALSTLNAQDVWTSLQRHASGDWGELSAQDEQENSIALEQDDRLFSVYHDRNGVMFYIITEADRSATTILLPEDY